MVSINLFDVRKKYSLSQAQTAKLLKIPLRTYIRYERDDNYGDHYKREYMLKTIEEKCEITEDRGILSVSFIQNTLKELFNSEYKDQIDFCYLFGSYSKGYAKESSDVDLCVSTSLSGLKFVGLSEAIRNVLHKRIDLIRFSNLKDNLSLVEEIMKDGIRIFKQV